MINYKYWIALEKAKGIGPANLKMIYNTLMSFGLTVTDLFSLSGSEIKEEFPFNEKIIDAIISSKAYLDEIEKIYCELLDAGIATILFFEESYPERLNEILKNAAPPVLYAYGNTDILKHKAAAILCERNISDKGKNIAHLAAEELSGHRIPIISGIADGMEIIHRSTLLNGGQSAAVLPYGILQFNLPDILKDIPNYDNFLILSPFYPNLAHTKFNVYIRNRIICALSCAIYIVESDQESGIFEAAKSSKKYNIPLFVTEYREYPQSASANNQLILDGAHAVKGRYVNKQLNPNMDEIIGLVKYR